MTNKQTMNRKKNLVFRCVAAVVIISLGLCLPATADDRSNQSPGIKAGSPALPAAQRFGSPAAVQGTVAESTPESRVIGELKARKERLLRDNAPTIRTLRDGTRIQRVPADPDAYNTYYLDAENRGCRSCHDDLRETLKTTPSVHLELGPMFGIDLTVGHCLGCHTYSPGHLKEPYAFGRLMHGLHRKSKGFQGDCASCHESTAKDGKFALWDDVKYAAYRGIVDVPNVKGDFSFSQDVITTDAELYSLNWLYDEMDYVRYASVNGGEELPEATFNDWTLSISGDVEKPYRIRLLDLLAEGASVTTIMKMHCTMNPPGGGLIENAVIRGIPLSYVLNKAGGVAPGATALFPSDSGGYSYPTTIEYLSGHAAYLVYEINGHRLSTVHGYPLQLWVDGMGAQAFVKQLSEIRVSSEPVERMQLYRGWKKENGEWFNKPNLAIFRTKDGQLVPAGKPFRFEGYADGFDQAISAIEVSMDRGKTWSRLDTPDTKTDKWLYWYFTFVPPRPDAYVISLRAITEKGLVSDRPFTLLVNAVSAASE